MVDILHQVPHLAFEELTQLVNVVRSRVVASRVGNLGEGRSMNAGLLRQFVERQPGSCPELVVSHQFA